MAQRSIDQQVIERVGAYRLERHLVTSGPVRVYLAREEGTASRGRPVILKIAQSLLPEDVEQVEELRHQAPLLCQLNHPGIVRTYRTFEHKDAMVFLVYHVDGATLPHLSHVTTREVPA